MTGCTCFEGKFATVQTQKALGMDNHYGEVSIQTCNQCGQHWLHYFYESEAFENSTRWYKGPLRADEADSLTPGDALNRFALMEWYFCGGRYFDGHIRKTSGNILLNP